MKCQDNPRWRGIEHCLERLRDVSRPVTDNPKKREVWRIQHLGSPPIENPSFR
jgi:hypothetical protein